MTYWLKWTATAILIVGTATNSLGIYPLGALILILGALLWLIVSIIWREIALIVTNTVLVSVAAGGLIYTYWLT
jgi:hypothetical protein